MERKQKTKVGQESKKPFPKMRPDAEDLMKVLPTLSREAILSIKSELAKKGILTQPTEQEKLVDRLAESSENGDVEMAQEILEQGADINGFNRDGRSALFMAADSEDNAEMIEFLLQNGADPNSTVPDSRLTPLHTTAYHGETESVKLLLESGADPNAVNKKGETPLMLAAKGLGMDVAEILMIEGPEQADKLQNSLRGNAELMRLLIEKGGVLETPEPEIRNLGDLMDLMKQSS